MANFCNACGLCCKLFYINLSRSEYKSGKYQTMFGEYGQMENFNEAKECGANLLAKKEDGSCVYLEDDGKCGIHDTRPGVCRDFFCTSTAKKFESMVEIIIEADRDGISSVSEKKLGK